jgi:hypothetical protein
MPTHELDLNLPRSTIVNSDAEVVVHSDGLLLGRLLISRGGVDWRPGNSKKFHYSMRWEKFADVMASEGRQATK